MLIVWYRALLGPDPKYRISILRSPSQTYESIFNGFKYEKVVQTPFSKWINQWDCQLKINYFLYFARWCDFLRLKVSASLYRYRFGSLGLGLNQQMAMFGLVGDDMYNPDLVKAKINEIDSKFDLVKINYCDHN